MKIIKKKLKKNSIYLKIIQILMKHLYTLNYLLMKKKMNIINIYPIMILKNMPQGKYIIKSWKKINK